MATTFLAGDSVSGTCTSATAYGSRVPTYTYTVFAASWDSEGALLSDKFCGTAVIGSRSTLATWTYAPGFDATTCYLPHSGHPDILIGNEWFGYVTTSPDGAYELLTLGREGYINQF